MFYVLVINDKIIAKANELKAIQEHGFDEIIKIKVEEKYGSKIIENEGICISIYDMQIMDSLVQGIEGDIQANV